ncbi:MAG: hypothetical protein K0S30_949 [Clostridia bacterium]|jgi:ribose transport system substrate-binding protein|nr:hypothetical protein [Clostridia bacterium]
MKKRNKQTIVGLIIGLIALSLLGAYSIDRQNRLPRKIVLIPKSVSPDFEFWQTVKMGAELAAKEENIIIETRGAMFEKNISEQKQILEKAIEEEVDIILLAATNVDALRELVERARKKGITLLTVDSTVEGVPHITKVATDNVQGAAILTRHLAELLESQGEVIMINFVEGASTAKERATGYEREISQYKEIIMHPTVYTQGTTADAYEATKNVLKKYPELKGIVAANQQVTDAVCEAVEEMGLQSQVSVVGFDSSQTIIYALERDIIDAIIVQKPFNMGYLAVKNGLQAYRGKKIPEYVDTGYKLINKETLYLTENQKLLYPIIK